MASLRILTFLLWVLLTLQPRLDAADPVPHAQAQFFESKVRPLLAKHCFECHSRRSERLKGGLRLDSRERLLQGGESGEVVVAGQPDESLLIQSVRYESLEMPPAQKLKPEEVRILERWVKHGAYFPESSEADADEGADQSAEQAVVVTDEHRKYWAYTPITRPEVPHSSTDSDGNEVDAFIGARLDQQELTPNRVATKSDLIRRAYLDLIGFPPTYEDVAKFQKDQDPHVWQRLIDQLLDQPQYGERWGRHWLDTVRFAQTNGYERDDEKPLAWQYRDYVIHSFNQDKPFDQFVIEQLAGDEIEPASDEAIVATGFYRLGVWDDEPDDEQAAEFDGLDDMLSTIGQVFLGQTIGCARCHDHMFDPIPQEDYYRMLSMIRNVARYVKPDAKEAEESIFAKLPSGNGKALAVRERNAQTPATHMLIRGDARTPGAEVKPAVLRVLCSSDDAALEAAEQVSHHQTSCGRRTALAKWIASRSNPLTARVIANRIWQHHFGVGIVPTPNDFGKAGLPPSHPKLLDWLAAELIDHSWSLKHLHRVIMHSAVYRRSSQAMNEKALQLDPDNRLLWRQNMRRLDAESIRDSILFVAGELNPQMGGRGIFPRMSGEVVAGQSRPGLGWDVSTSEQRHRRSVYIFVKRGLRDPMMEAFDYVNTTAPLGARPTTTVAPQALLLLNSSFVEEQSQTLAKRIRSVEVEPSMQLRRLFRRTLQREPSDADLDAATEYLSQAKDEYRRLSTQLSFRPDVPPSLSGQFRKKLTGADFLIGPKSSWSYHAGRWGNGYEGIDVVDTRLTPFSLFENPTRSSQMSHALTVAGRVKLLANTRMLTILLDVDASDSGWVGLAFEIDVDAAELRIVQRVPGESEPQTILTTNRAVAIDQWTPFRAEVDRQSVAIRFGDWQATETVKQVKAGAVGQFGVSPWGDAVLLDELSLTVGEQPPVAVATLSHIGAPANDATVDSVEDMESWVNQQAFAGLCKVLFNLNEFVYVD